MYKNIFQKINVTKIVKNPVKKTLAGFQSLLNHRMQRRKGG